MESKMIVTRVEEVRMSDADFERYRYGEGWNRAETEALLAETRRARIVEMNGCGVDSRCIEIEKENVALRARLAQLSSAAALMGAKGGAAGKGKPKPRHVAATAKARGAKGGSVTGPSKRRSVDYAALGREGGLVRKEESKT